MTTPLKHYLATIEAALKAGNATEHTHRPALKALLESMDLGLTATNEPKRIACGAPDYILTRHDLIVGYIEAKDVGKSLAETERSEQLKRYRRALDNLVLTDYLEFRWYVGGDLRQEARLAQPQPGGKLKPGKDGLAEVERLLRAFLAHQPQGINTPKDLAERLARLTHIIRDIIITVFETDQASPLLRGWREAFARVLLADLSLPERTPDFADMFAQTLAYGLFTARVMDPTPPPSIPPRAGGGKGGVEGRGSEESPPSPPAERGLGGEVFTPEDIFHYIYAIFHSPTYRRCYAEFLKIDFPRVPLTSDVGLFRTLGRLGQELVGLHLLETPLPSGGGVRFPVGGDNRVDKGYPKYTSPTAAQPGRVYLNPGQYFEGIAPEVWAFYVGGYQVLEKWLEDRQGRQLSYDDLTHYRQVVAALGRTIEVMAEIEEVIPQWPLV